MQKVAFIIYKDSPDLSDSDKLLVEQMLKLGYEVSAAAWDDSTIDWTKFDYLVFRSCWNYHYKVEEFTNWLSRLEDLKIKTWNPISVIKWNINKSYLKDLKERYLINTIPTIYIKKGDQSDLGEVIKNSGWPEVVVKPSFGASGYKIFKSTLAEANNYKENFYDLLKTSGVMIQPLIQELVDNGETSLVFLNKKFSHAVNRKPKKGDFRSNYDFGGIETRIEPDKIAVEGAEDILSKIVSPLLYARVDGIVKDNKFMLMELGLIEPYLFMDLCQESAQMFAEAFKDLSK